MQADDLPAGGRLNLYTLDRVAEMTGWSLSHLRRAIRAGKLITHEFGRSIRVSQADLEAFLAASRRERATTKKPIKSTAQKSIRKRSG